MASIGDALASALWMAFAMGWEILWPLIFGFALSGVVQAVVIKGEMGRLLPDASLRSIVIATALGAVSSSCSYAAVALARSIFRKGADFVAAMAFQFASTNHPRRADWMAIRCRRVRRRLDNDRAADRHATRRHEPSSDRGSAARDMLRWICRLEARDRSWRESFRPRASPRSATTS
jgi:hypothetical protein